MLLQRSIHLIPAMLLALSGTAFAEEELTIEQVPAPVAATLRVQAGGAVIDEIEAKQHDGKSVYEAEIHKQSGKLTVVVAADGTVVQSETKIAVTAMPAAVQAAITKAFGAQAPTRGESETEGAVTTYSVEGMIGYDEVEISFAADGSERSREVQKAGGRDEGEHEDDGHDDDGQDGKGQQHGHQGKDDNDDDR
ncbi:MAG: hypothetical protein IPK19_28275 [Chloroflexi bacterium]|nr:hypothetical protein [Chloroflexota bacterium]